MNNLHQAHEEQRENSVAHHPHIRSFGSARRSSLSSKAQEAWDHHHEEHALGMGDVHRWSREGDRPKIVEIGCGMGEATVEIALRHPENDYLAIDVYRPGLARIMGECHEKGIKNLKVLEGDAMVAIDELETNSISGFHVFFPDPWPKDRHHKRRLMREEVIEKMGKSLKKDGFLYFATDWLPYGSDTLEKMGNSALFANAYPAGDGFATSVPGRPSTRFEKKGLEKGHSIWEIYFKRV